MYTETRIHKQYTPLSLAVVVRATGTATAQLYNQFEGTLTPQRTPDAPTVFIPDVQAIVNDNAPDWQNGNKVSLLTEVQWLANGEDISNPASSVYADFHTASGEPLFSIVSAANDTNASLRLWLNPSAEKRYTMQLSAKLTDPRTKHTHVILSDGIDIYVNTLGASEWDFSVVHDTNIRYSPCYDNLRLYDYLCKKNVITASDSLRNTYCDGMQYDLSLPFLISYGHSRYTADDKLRFRVFDHLRNHAELTPSNCSWITELDNKHLRVDQRFLDGERVVADIQMEILTSSGTWLPVAQEQLTFTRWFPAIDAMPTNISDIDLTADTRPDHALVLFNGHKVDHPLAYLTLKWYARSSESDPWTYQGEGEDVIINQRALGIGVNARDTLYIRLEYDLTIGYALLVDNEGRFITDNEGRFITVMY